VKRSGKAVVRLGDRTVVATEPCQREVLVEGCDGRLQVALLPGEDARAKQRLCAASVVRSARQRKHEPEQPSTLRQLGR
jgi:hypothetical protein